MGDEEPVTQQPSSDEPEQDTAAQATAAQGTDTSAEGSGTLKPEDDPLAPPKYKP